MKFQEDNLFKFEGIIQKDIPYKTEIEYKGGDRYIGEILNGALEGEGKIIKKGKLFVSGIFISNVLKEGKLVQEDETYTGSLEFSPTRKRFIR